MNKIKLQLMSLFESNWTKWEPFAISVKDPSHEKYWVSHTPGFDANQSNGHCVDEFKTDIRLVYVIMRKKNMKTGMLKFKEVYIGQQHKDHITMIEELTGLKRK